MLIDVSSSGFTFRREKRAAAAFLQKGLLRPKQDSAGHREVLRDGE